MEARPDGFLLTFTKPVDDAAAARTDAYTMSSFTYERHAEYGSPEFDRDEVSIRHVEVSGDGRSVRLVLDRLRPGYVHELKMAGVRSADGEPLLHDEAYYTLNRVPR